MEEIDFGLKMIEEGGGVVLIHPEMDPKEWFSDRLINIKDWLLEFVEKTLSSSESGWNHAHTH